MQPLVEQLRSIGTRVDNFPLQLSTRFLQHFSEQLYSSPQKAFEELVSNGWDAGATCVDVFIPTDLQYSDAALAVFDNGESMDIDGLHQLWRIADSPKAQNPTHLGRPVVGKFGIGKLATYVLADQLTHICRTEDGIIRRVTMDYGALRAEDPDKHDKLVSDMMVEIYEATIEEVRSLVSALPYGDRLQILIDGPTLQHGCEAAEEDDLANMIEMEEGEKDDEVEADADEFGAFPDEFAPLPSGRWTLVLLSKLKPAGRSLKAGILHRVLASSLPMASSMAIRLNGEPVHSSKVQRDFRKTWTIGPDLGIEKFAVAAPDADAPPREITLTYGSDPVPYVLIPGVGKVTGQARLFVERLTGGRSDEHGASNGFHVNVLGRVINGHDPAFGETDLSHAAWSRFRMTVRADGLNQFLITNREGLRDCDELRTFRSFLRAVFNKARVEHDSIVDKQYSDPADTILRALGPVSLQPLRDAVTTAIKDADYLPELIDRSGLTDIEDAVATWQRQTSETLASALRGIKTAKRTADAGLASFHVQECSLVVNTEHPFVLEHSTKEELDLIRELSLVTFLTDLFGLDVGLRPGDLAEMIRYRERLLRAKSYQSRRSAALVAHLLEKFQRFNDYHPMEVALSAAMNCLGFEVTVLAVPGEPEGVARAVPVPRRDIEERDLAYSFTYDAKTTQGNDKIQTGNINYGFIESHRRGHGADFTLVVGPDFQAGKLAELNEKSSITTMRAHDLARLLEATAMHGPIPFSKFREVFGIFDPVEVSRWVDGIPSYMSTLRRLTLGDYLAALSTIKVRQTLQSIEPSLIQDKLEAAGITADQRDIVAISKALEVLLPEAISSQGDSIRIDMSPDKLAEAIRRQLTQLQAEVA
jgi:hypothetical protein